MFMCGLLRHCVDRVNYGSLQRPGPGALCRLPLAFDFKFLNLSRKKCNFKAETHAMLWIAYIVGFLILFWLSSVLLRRAEERRWRRGLLDPDQAVAQPLELGPIHSRLTQVRAGFFRVNRRRANGYHTERHLIARNGLLRQPFFLHHDPECEFPGTDDAEHRG